MESQVQTDDWLQTRPGCFALTLNLYAQGEASTTGAQTGFQGRYFRKELTRRHGCSRLKRLSEGPPDLKDFSPPRDLFLPQSPSPARRLNTASQVRERLRLPLVEKVPRRLRPLKREYCRDWRAALTLTKWPLGKFDNTPRLR
jgi:hypothetical protein